MVTASCSTIGNPESNQFFATTDGNAPVPIPGPDFLVNSAPTLSNAHPNIAALPDGDFVMTWTTDGGDGQGYCIRARMFDANGGPLGNDFVVNSTTADLQARPAITALADGHFVATWRSADDADGSSGCIRARLFNADGSAVATDFIANSTSASDQ